MNLTGRNIVLGVTGGIAAYKSAEVVSRLRHLGANVHVILTKNAAEFVAPLTFRTLSANPVVTDMFAEPEEWNVEHVALAKLADIFAVVPATANILAKVLVVMTPEIVRHMKKGAVYITSGILDVQEKEVTDAIQAAGLTLLEVTRQGEWISVTARKD